MWREHHSGNVINASVALVTRKCRASYQHAAHLCCGGVRVADVLAMDDLA
jgi:hypothetical protein